jgi:hypothetical protein
MLPLDDYKQKNKARELLKGLKKGQYLSLKLDDTKYTISKSTVSRGKFLSVYRRGEVVISDTYPENETVDRLMSMARKGYTMSIETMSI